MKTKNIFLLTTLALFCAVLLSSCQKDEAVNAENARLFKPTDLDSFKKANGMVIRWATSYGASSYTIDLSKSDDFSQPVFTVDCPADESLKRYETTVDDLEENALYYIRLKATSKSGELDSKYIYGQCTTGMMVSLFKTVSTEHMTYDAVTLQWTEDVDATHIFLTANNQPDIVVELTEADLAAKTIVVPSLREGVKYRAAFVLEGVEKSYTTFTMPKKPTGAIIVTASDDLKSIIESAPDNAVIILTGGQAYDYTTQDINIDRGITLMRNPGTPRPLIYLKRLVVGSAAGTYNIDKIRFEDIEFSGFQLNGGNEDSSVRPGDAVLYFNTRYAAADINIGSIEVENCTVRNFGISFIFTEYTMMAGARLRIDNIAVNNVLAFDLGRDIDNIQSFIALSSNPAADIYCPKFSIANSTFYYLHHGLIESRGVTANPGLSPPAVTVTNCTFDYMGAIMPGVWRDTKNRAHRYLFDFANHSSQTTVTMADCLFGAVTTGNGDYWIRPNTPVNNGTLSASTLFKSTDCTLSNGNFSAGITATGKSASAMFPARGQFDFTPETGDMSRTGDPRWWEE